MTEEALTLAVRVVNAAAWTMLCYALLRDKAPASFLIRGAVILTMAVGMWILVLGGLTPFGFPGWLARGIYTAFTAGAAIVAFGVITGPWQRPR